MSVAGDQMRLGPGPAASFFSRGRRSVRRAALATAAAVASLVPRRPYRVLRLVIGGDVPETEPGLERPRLAALRPRAPSVLDLLSVLRAARTDDALALVVVEIDGVGAGWSRLQTLRRALAAVHAAGKPVWAYLTHAGMREYYLASAADRIWLAPTATFEATGIASEVVFLKDALDRLGVEAQVVRIGRWKSAAETFTRRDMSDEHRAMVEGLVDDLHGQLVADVAAARRLPEDAVRGAMAEAPLLAAEAKRRGLVDDLGHPEDLEAALAERCGERATIELPRYLRRRRLALRRAALDAPRVGLLAVQGTIAVGGVPATGGRASAWRCFRRELGRLASDDGVAAVVLRVDSPGGSAVASDLMWRAVVEARRRKPVLVSMGDVAASGGYYLAAAADHVTAEPGTLTGSIGVLAGKPVLRGLYERLGVRKELVTRGNAAYASDWMPLRDEDVARLRGGAEHSYDEFVARVAEGRKLTREAVENVAEGRVWTGKQAQGHGLVDALGGLEDVFGEVRRRLGVALDAPLAVDVRPAPRSLWQLVRGRGEPEAAATSAAGNLAEAMELLASGERALAVMPVAVRFLPSPPLGSELRAAAGLLPGGGAAPAAAGLWDVLARVRAHFAPPTLL